MRAVIMAGGEGKRLRPLTNSMPKPMLPIGSQPILEIIINRLRGFGFKEVTITLGYKGELIKSYFANGENFGIDIKYVMEEKKLGTAGALSLLHIIEDTSYLVMNGDILTDTDLNDMFRFHEENGSDITVAVKDYNYKIPYGVTDVDADGRLKGVVEKPDMTCPVLAGIYIIKSEILSGLTKNVPLAMPDFIQRGINEKKLVMPYKIIGKWLDIGNIDDFNKVEEFIMNYP